LSKSKADYAYETLGRLIKEIPIYYRSWQQLYEAFEQAIPEFVDQRNLEQWQRIGSEVKELARRAGKYR
jgi:hypothetical protein